VAREARRVGALHKDDPTPILASLGSTLPFQGRDKREHRQRTVLRQTEVRRKSAWRQSQERRLWRIIRDWDAGLPR
jgi:hypothetical protein